MKTVKPLIIIVLFLCAAIHAEVLVREDFKNYNGNLYGKNGGIGFNSNWSSSSRFIAKTSDGKVTMNLYPAQSFERKTLINLEEHEAVYVGVKFFYAKATKENCFFQFICEFGNSELLSLGAVSNLQKLFASWSDPNSPGITKLFSTFVPDEEYQMITKLSKKPDGGIEASVFFNTKEESSKPDAKLDFKPSSYNLQKLYIGTYNVSIPDPECEFEWRSIIIGTKMSDLFD